MGRLLELEKFCRSEFDSEARSGFFTLRRVPSSRICGFLHYYSELGVDERNAFAEAASQWAVTRADQAGAIAIQTKLKENEAWKHWVNWNVMNAWRFPSIPMLRLHAARATIEEKEGHFFETAKESEI